MVLRAFLNNSLLLTHWAREFPDLAQFDLLSPADLSDRAQKFGLNLILTEKTIIGLWQVGLLRADLVVSTRRLNRKGITLARKTDEGEYVYCDLRCQKVKRSGWASSLEKTKPLPKYIKLYFHPFRHYVLWNLENQFDPNIIPMQFVLGADRYAGLVERVLSSINSHTKSKEFCVKVNEWNDDVALAAVFEPCVYTKIFRHIRYRVSPYTDEIYQADLIAYRERMYPLLIEVGLEKVEEKRAGLCRMAEIIDPNKDLHTLLRLTNSDTRLKIKGKVGGAMLLLTMAETLRRAAEDAFAVSLPEEDQMGFGQWMRGAREMKYGTNRIFDASEVVRKKFLGSCGLNTAPRFRCYVEGDTEYSALDSVFMPESGVQLINLKGQVIEKRRKGLAFRDSLRNDKQAHILSIVILDGDRNDFEQAVRNAAKQDEMYGQFYIQKNDFETQNFSNEELAEVLWLLAEERGAFISEKEKLTLALKGVTSGTEIIKRARQSVSELNQLGKGAKRGEALMAYAGHHPNRNDTGEKRQFIEILEVILRGLSSWYHNTPHEHRVDENTGKLVERVQKNVES